MQIENQESNQSLNNDSQRKGRLIVLAMVVFFITPIVVVILMYKLNWMPSAGTSLGELVTPPRLIKSPTELQNSENKPISAGFWKDKWSIAYVSDQCEQACESRLHDMRQIHVSLYKEMDRAQRVLITSATDVKKYREMYPELVVINQPSNGVENLSTQFNMANETASKTNRVYLVDPLGHIMMSYPATTSAANIRKDVSQLLRYSWAG